MKKKQALVMNQIKTLTITIQYMKNKFPLFCLSYIKMSNEELKDEAYSIEN